jgi:cell division protein FtsI (penicillin-binding protein 3)
MKRRLQNTSGEGLWKIRVVAALLILALGGLWCRAAYVQLYLGEKLSAMVRRQHLAAEFERGKRGEIFDRKGRLLAQSVQFTSVYARPVEIEDRHKAARILAKATGKSSRQIARRLNSRSNFVWVARQLGDKAAARVRNADIKGIHLTHEYSRLYPNNHLAGQILGFAGLDGRGLEGLELSLQDELAGRKAEFVFQRDASGRKLYMDSEGREIDIDGKDVYLSLDSYVQDMAETAVAQAVNAHQGRWGAMVVVDVPTGEILAMANYPFFNPNMYRSSKPGDARNRASLDVFEPGSTLKPFLMAAALQEGQVTPESLYFCENGRWRVRNHTIRDTHDYEWLTTSKIMRYSSNIGVAKIGLEMGAPKYHEYLERLGFTEKPGVGLPGEGKGLIRPPGAWNEVDLAAASFGQGVGVTLLQMAQAYLSIAGDGHARQLTILRDEPGTRMPGNRVFSEEVAAQVRQMLIDVVQEGTGKRCRIPGVIVGGKTGTAQKAAAGGYGKKHMASFVALVPGDTPKYLIAAVVDEPEPNHYGGVVVAPAVREVAQGTLAYNYSLPATQLAETSAAQPAKAHVPRTSRSNAVSRTAVRPTTADDFPKDQLPDLRGLSLRQAVEVLVSRGVVPRIEGRGNLVARQDPKAGSRWNGQQTTVTLWLDRREES